MKKSRIHISRLFSPSPKSSMIPAPLASVTTRQVTGEGLDLFATFTVHLKGMSMLSTNPSTTLCIHTVFTQETSQYSLKTKSWTFVVPLAAITKFLLPSGQRINSQEVSRSSGTWTQNSKTKVSHLYFFSYKITNKLQKVFCTSTNHSESISWFL